MALALLAFVGCSKDDDDDEDLVLPAMGEVQDELELLELDIEFVLEILVLSDVACVFVFFQAL